MLKANKQNYFTRIFLSVDIKSLHAEISGETNWQLSCVAGRSLTPHFPHLPRRSSWKRITL